MAKNARALATRYAAAAKRRGERASDRSDRAYRSAHGAMVASEAAERRHQLLSESARAKVEPMRQGLRQREASIINAETQRVRDNDNVVAASRVRVPHLERLASRLPKAYERSSAVSAPPTTPGPSPTRLDQLRDVGVLAGGAAIAAVVARNAPRWMPPVGRIGLGLSIATAGIGAAIYAARQIDTWRTSAKPAEPGPVQKITFMRAYTQGPKAGVVETVRRNPWTRGS